MDTDAAPATPVLPRSPPFEASGSRTAVVVTTEEADRNTVFGHLVHEDGDIAGLVAYSIYKQHKLDWLRAFEAAKGRVPNEDELVSYIIGEGTPRRLATYRHLAEATLAGNGPEVTGAPALAARPVRTGRRAGVSEGIGTTAIALYALIAVLFIIGFYLALHFTATTR